MRMTLIEDIENDFISVEQTGEPTGSNLDKVINNALRTPINKEKLVKKLESHPRPENLDSLKVKKMQHRNLEQKAPV